VPGVQSLSYRIVEIFVPCSLLEFPPYLISKAAIGVFTDLESENGGLNELEGLSVDLDCSNSLVTQFLLSLPSNPSKANVLRPLPVLAMATAVAVRFLPKQATLWVVEDMVARVLSVVGRVVDKGFGQQGRWRRDSVFAMFCGCGSEFLA
jgi:hypothetical protein